MTVHAAWDLEGLSCSDCARRAADQVGTLAGVESAQIRLITSQLVLDYDPDHLPWDRLHRILRQEGIRLLSGAESSNGDARVWAHPPLLRTVFSGALFLIGLALGYGPFPNPLLLAWGYWVLPLSGGVFIASAVTGGWNFLPGALVAVRRRRLDMHVLMSVAIIGAVALTEFTEAAAIAFLFSVAERLERFAVGRTRRSLKELVALAPRTARLRTSAAGVREGVPVDEIRPGQVVIVRAGERLPVDGEIVEGTGSIDQSTITGESIPAEKGVGGEVFAGSVLVDGYVEIGVTRPHGDSTLQRIVRLIREAESLKAPSERFVDRFARVYTPAVVITAVVVAVIPPVVAGVPFGPWILRALTLLVIACPCALVIATPVAVVSALTAAARSGVLIKGGKPLEALGGIGVVAFDKTGTLTTGRHRLLGVEPLNGYQADRMLRLAAALELRSSHPLARAVVEAWRRDGQGVLPEVTSFTTLAGRGIEGRIEGIRWRLGRPDLFTLSSVAVAAVSRGAARGATSVVIGPADGPAAAVLTLSDTVRPEAAGVIARLRKGGVRHIVMLTGDHTAAARAVADRLGIEQVHAGLLPEEKMELLRELRRRWGPVAMVGDGVNDAPALALADVGIAMGAAGTEAALESADVALMADDLHRLPDAFALSRRALRVIRQNIGASLALKFGLALGVFPGVVTLITAVLVGDMGASLGVTANALRLARVPEKGMTEVNSDPNTPI